MIILYHIRLFIISFLLYKSTHSWNKNNCYDYNKGLERYGNSTNTDISNYYQCPDYDGIDSNACLFPLKTRMNRSDINNITFTDIVIIMLIGGSKGKGNETVRHYWLDMIPPNISLDIVLIADSCYRNDDRLNQSQCPSTDPAHVFKNDLHEKHINNNHTISIVRTQGVSDFGYFRLACKTLTGF